ncbi:MAG TPA: MFS transporter [Chloroflexota bacterium]|jgi:FSR family fosmidomycin resistance protein-like MFS transporter
MISSIPRHQAVEGIVPAPEQLIGAGIDRRLIGVLTAGHLFDDINQGAIAAMVPFFLTERHLSYAAVSALVLAGTIASSVVQPLFGHLADRRAAAWLAGAGVFVAGLGIALAGIAPTYLLSLLAVGLSGIGVAAFHPEATRLANYASGNRRATGISFFSVGGNIGFAIGPLLATPLLLAFGLRGTVLLIIPSSLAAVTLLWHAPRFASLRRTVTARRAAGRETAVDQWRPFARLTATVVCRSIVFFGLNTFIPIYWIAVLHQSKAQAGLALTLFGVAGATGTLAGGRLADRFGRGNVVRVSLGLLCPAMLLLLLAGSGPLALILLVPVALTLYASNSVMVVMGQEYLPNHLGTASGVTLGLAMTIGGLMVPLLGLAADSYGVHTALTGLALLPLLAAGLALTLPVTRHRLST